MTKDMLSIAYVTLKASQLFQKDISNLTEKWFLKNKVAPNASTVLSFIYTHAVPYRSQGMCQMYTCTPQPSDQAQSEDITICPKCLKKDHPPSLNAINVMYAINA